MKKSLIIILITAGMIASFLIGWLVFPKVLNKILKPKPAAAQEPYVPAGADTLSVNGVPVVPEPDGAPGWALLLTRPRTAYDLLLTGGGRSLAEALLYGITSGFMLVFW